MKDYNYDINLEDQINQNISNTYNKMNEALSFARKKHEGQTREDGSPYINHPIMVAKIVEKFFKDDLRVNELITAAYLHDVLEDTNTSPYVIANLFGKYVAYLVYGVTNNDELKHNMGKTDYLCYKIINMNDDILKLKLCDRLANVMDLRNASSEFREKYIAETLIIINFLICNRTINSIELEIIKEINNEISNLRKEKILNYKFV